MGRSTAVILRSHIWQLILARVSIRAFVFGAGEL